MRPYHLIAIFVLLLSIESTLSALLNEACQSTSDCMTENTVCSPLAFICTPFGAYCQCQPGYRENRGRCKKVAYYNESCGDQGICASDDSHLICNIATSRCECSIGYRPDYSKNPVKCGLDPVITPGLVGEDCSNDPVDTCDKNSECLGGICSCITGYMYDDVKDACVKIGLGDGCVDDRDCVNVIRAVCDKDIRACECPVGLWSQSVTYKKEPVVACLPPDTFPKSIGQNCSETGPLLRSYCRQPFQCTQCTPTGSVSICAVAEISHFVATLTTINPAETVPTTTEEPIVIATAEIATPTVLVPAATTTTMAQTTITSQTVTVPTTATTTLQKALLGEECVIDLDCGVLFSACSSEGTCQCQDGYVNRSTTECREYFARIPLGQDCDPVLDDGFCAAGAVCINSTCQCGVGFKNGPRNDDCVEASRAYGYHDSCRMTNQCYYNLVCTQSKCQCSLGYKKASYYHCKPRELEDSCASGLDAECRLISRAVCSKNRCKCAPGFTRQSSTSCVPLTISQTTISQEIWPDGYQEQVPCTSIADCQISNVAPKLSTCLASTMKCGCPSHSVYNKTFNRCIFATANDDRGFSCIYDSDCKYTRKCIRNTCGGTAPFLFISSAPSTTYCYYRPVSLSLILLPILLQKYHRNLSS